MVKRRAKGYAAALNLCSNCNNLRSFSSLFFFTFLRTVGAQQNLEQSQQDEKAYNGGDYYYDGDDYTVKSLFHKTIKKVTNDIETLKFNTAIAALMALLNEFSGKSMNKAELRTFLILLNPFAPHISEEMFEANGFGILNEQSWCEYDEALCKDDEIEIVVQVNGKVRGKLTIATGTDKDSMIAAGKELLGSAIAGKEIVKEIAVPDKLVNIVVK